MTDSSSSSNNNNKEDNINSTKIEEMLPLRLQSIVVRGFGRGSSDLGIPTANLDRSNCQAKSVPLGINPSLENLHTGIYWGYGRIGNDQVYTAAISIGYNPTYGNSEKTVEPHLIAPESDPRRHCSSCGETVLQEFYDQPIRLSVVEYLRPELPFEGLDSLISAIKNDIVQSVSKASIDDPSAGQEKEWVAGNDSV